jgi:Tc toxin complex TcA C-terminal TcB-binding domain/Concanavalin A-like lectin/glucanases superfamily
MPLATPGHPPRVAIAAVTPVAGVTISVTGTYYTGDHAAVAGDPPGIDTLDSVVANNTPATITPPAHPVLGAEGTWSADVVFGSPGPHTVEAVISASYGAFRATATSSIPVSVQDPDVTLAVVSAPTSATLAYLLQVDAVSPIGVGLVALSTDGGATWSSLGNDVGARWSAHVVLAANPVADVGTTKNLLLAGFDPFETRPASDAAPGWSSPAPRKPWTTFAVTAVDSTAPSVQWLEPPADSLLEITDGLAPTAQTTLRVLVSDDGNGVASAGPPSSVRCRVDGGNWLTLGDVTTNDPALWESTVALDGVGAHTLELMCGDNATPDNMSYEHRIVTVRAAGALTTTLQDYLADLLDFAWNRVFTSAQDGRRLTPLDLADRLCEPFLQLVGTGGRPRTPAVVARAPINAVRGAVEVLRRYLIPRPLAHWRLEEGTGAVVRDDSGNGLHGALMSVEWGAGRDGAAAPVFDGASGYVEIGSQPQLDVRGAELTVAAWIMPVDDRDGVIAERDQSYGVARIGGALKWILSTPQPGWDFQETGVELPRGTWSHVAIVYDGARVRAYLNGALASAIVADGTITPQPVPGVDFRIGCRQTGDQLFFAGSITDVAVYGHALTGHDIQLLAGGTPAPTTSWVDDDLPAEAQVEGADNEGFDWTTASPTPYSGARCHQSPTAPGIHQHYFTGVVDGWPVDRFDRLYAHIYLDPAEPPRALMLQWFDDLGSWKHRACWGEDMLLAWGVPGTPSHQLMGPLPPAGRWVRLEVPAALVGLDNSRVTGLAFTLYGGQAWWDASGRAGGVATLADCGYPAAAYEALLAAFGTSLEELRVVRGATPQVRQALAARLGFTLSTNRPDELDQLLRSTSTVGEGDLEQLFGLQRTDTDPLATIPGPPLLLGWQQQRLRSSWALEDYATTQPSDYTPPIIDPDVVAESDILSPSPGQTAFDLWQQRTDWVHSKTQNLQQLRAAQAPPSAGLAAIVAEVLPGFDLQDTANQQAAGYRITEILNGVLLDLAGFDRLMMLSALSIADALTDDEWDDACAILVQVAKIRQFPAWRQEEQTHGLLLDPAIFDTSAPTPALTRWRAAWSSRMRWQDRLAARADQTANLEAGLGAAVAAAESVALPILRDAALEIAAPTDPAALSTWLCVDLQVGPQLTITRLGQATQAMQGLFAQLDAGGGLAGLGVSWTVPVPSGYADRDSVLGELSWMGDYNSWQTAMSVFLYPENHVVPGTRPETTLAFNRFQSSLTSSGIGALSEQGARQLAAAYWNDATWVPPGKQPPYPAPWHLLPGPDGYPLHPAPPAQSFDPWPPHAASDATDYPAHQFPYTERLSETDIAAIRDVVERPQFAGPGGEPAPKLSGVAAWLRELFFDLPMQLALSLAQAGQWRGALGWLRIVYDHEQPRPLAGAADQRQIFAGFALEPTTETITRSEYWLNGGQLDAHLIAADRAHSYLRFTLLTLAGVACDWADAEFSNDVTDSRSLAANLYTKALDVLSAPELIPAPGLAPNPELTALANRAAVNLAKLRSGLNIAGLTRPLATQASGIAAPSPTNYRYNTLIARAQQLITPAAQIEASYLASLEKEDNENYQQLLAQQDLDLAGAHVTIANEQAAVAGDEIDLAQLQVKRAQTQSDTYASWITSGPNQYEQDQLTQIGTEQTWRGWAAQAQALEALSNAAASAIGSYGMSIAAGLAGAAAAELGNSAEQAGLTSQTDALHASWERRQDEWGLQKQLADADVAIGHQQTSITIGRAQIADDEAVLASLTQSNAKAKLTFLQTKLTNAALYAWMAGVLAGVYRNLLQRAGAVARLAERQLAFERQSAVPGYIKSDYWSAPSGSSAPASGTAGLTGSARLLQDIVQLDDYAFDTNTRKAQLTQTFSLATAAPVDLQRFRETGVLPIAIPLSSYGTPGMYLAMIRSIRISLAALIAPGVGIRATLAGGGSSRIVVKQGDVFNTVALARAPETVLLTSPANASGVFQVDLTPELQLPWEGCGLDVALELRMPKPINPFDYRTIADVQISIDYTALYSPDYAARVVTELATRTSNSIALSLRDLPDSWYRLVAQAQAASQANPAPSDPLLAQWDLTTDMFPTNLSDLAVEQITLLVLRAAEAELNIDHLHLNGEPSATTTAKTVNHVISTRNGSGAAWSESMLTGSQPTGSWELGLTPDQDTIAAVAGGDVQDLVLVIGYRASLPAWPT